MMSSSVVGTTGRSSRLPTIFEARVSFRRTAAVTDAAPITNTSRLPSAAPSSDRSSTLTPQYLVWLAYQQWSTETSPSRRFELFRRIKHLSSVSGLGSFADLCLAYVRPARRCPTIAATTIQAKMRGFLCRRTPLQRTTLGGIDIAISTYYEDVPLSGTAQPTITYYEPRTHRDRISIPTDNNQSVAPSKKSRRRCRHRRGRPPRMKGGSTSTSTSSSRFITRPRSPSTTVPPTASPFVPSSKRLRRRRRYRTRYKRAASSVTDHRSDLDWYLEEILHLTT